MNDDREPSERRGLIRKIRLWLMRPGTLKVAFAVLRLVHWVLKFFDLL
jgi:hypothetical protein